MYYALMKSEIYVYNRTLKKADIYILTEYFK